MSACVTHLTLGGSELLVSHNDSLSVMSVNISGIVVTLNDFNALHLPCGQMLSGSMLRKIVSDKNNNWKN